LTKGSNLPDHLERYTREKEEMNVLNYRQN